MAPPRLVSEAQVRLLLQVLQEKPEMANGRSVGQVLPVTKHATMLFWKSVASKLNAIGTGTPKTALKWRDYWTERKYAVRKKVAKMRAHATGHGGVPASQIKLTDEEEIIFNIIGTTVFGEPEVRITIDEPPTSEDEPPLSPAPVLVWSPNTTPPPILPCATSPTLPCPAPPLEHHSAEQQGENHFFSSNGQRMVMETQLTTQAPAWAVEMESRRLEVEERIAGALDRLATSVDIQTQMLRELVDEYRRRP